jgi:hypothetical protein
MICAFVRRIRGSSGGGEASDDEFERWKATKPLWSEEQYYSNSHHVQYWNQMSSKYPNLGRFALDILTIPASSCNCERLFSELGDLLESRQQAISWLVTSKSSKDPMLGLLACCGVCYYHSIALTNKGFYHEAEAEWIRNMRLFLEGVIAG